MEEDSPLTKLPAEIRINIYRLALIEDGSIRLTSAKIPTLPGLLQSCGQIRSEAKRIYLSENSFCLPIQLFYVPTGSDWLHKIGRENCELIKHLSIEADVTFRSGARVPLSSDQWVANPACVLQRARRVGSAKRSASLSLARTVIRDVAEAGLNLKIVKPAGPSEIKNILDPSAIVFKGMLAEVLQELIEK